MTIAIAYILCYLLGGIPFGLLVGKWARGIDIRTVGSGNIGASNVIRTLGWTWGAVVMALDTVKGVAACYLCRALVGAEKDFAPYWITGGALLSVFGHNWSPFLKFQGGRGVATSLGVLIGLTPLCAALAFALWCVMLAVTRYFSVASLVGATSAAVTVWVWYPQPPYVAIVMLMFVFIVLRHRPNIKRLLAGTEPKLGRAQKEDSVERSAEKSRDIPN